MKKLMDGQILMQNNVGGLYPYMFKKEDGIYYSDQCQSAVSLLSEEERVIDEASVYSMLCYGYICGDRTLIRNLFRLPWLTEFHSSGELVHHSVEPYNLEESPPKEIAKQLIAALSKEIREQCQNYDHIYLLLSGGMDSRVVAAILRQLEKNGEIQGRIHAVTWGKNNSRDVVYAQKISELFQWEWHYAELNESYLLSNFELAAVKLGAEISPAHLHRFNWFERLGKDSIVLAGSYGDSIGRAEYSSVHASRLKPHCPRERYSLLNTELLNDVDAELKKELAQFRARYKEASYEQLNEYEMQAHYLRRMLGNAANLIMNWTHFYQAFTAKEVFTLMWKYRHTVRNDQIYFELLQMIEPKLLDLAWARTGNKYGGDGEGDTLSKKHHDYGLWLRKHCSDFMEEHLFNQQMHKLNLFDMKQLAFMYKEWRKEPEAIHSKLGDRLSWITVLSLFVNHYGLQSRSQRVKRSIIDIPKLKAKIYEKTYRIGKSIQYKA
ncbi:asparagine synthase-related protein [Paenibacillus sp. SAFN-117]|uniref:asparagine synthase-related protein n=1 Tax=Paenibacillus sp. SAFN-117 TaxID=3436860 RepID=UPI003F822C84